MEFWWKVKGFYVHDQKHRSSIGKVKKIKYITKKANHDQKRNLNKGVE
jgi:hypothetical protein